MGDLGVMIDLSRPEREQLAPEVRAEVRRLAPSTVDNGSITSAKLADGSVTRPKLAVGAVGGNTVEVGGIGKAALAVGAVTSDKLADRAVSRAKCGIGVLTVADTDGNPITLEAVPISSLDYAALPARDPEVLYLIYEGT